jgi:hypothetical protein
MHWVALYALTGSILASAIGGIVLCSLIVRYGFAPPSPDEPVQLTHRRFFATRLTHAIAAVCFAATAVLSVVAVARLAGAGRQTPIATAEDVRALEARVAAIEDIVHTVDSALAGILQRLEEVAPAASPRTPAR